MYEKCIKCDRLGKNCIPNIYTMSVSEMRVFARKLKEHKGWTNAQLAEKSGVPKGTVDANLAKKGAYNPDVTYSTFAPILCALLECELKEMPCPDIIEQQNKTIENQDKAIEDLEKENSELKTEIENEWNRHEENLNATKAEYQKNIDFLKTQLRERKSTIIVAFILLAVTVLTILGALLYDILNLQVGFFRADSTASVAELIAKGDNFIDNQTNRML